LHGHWNWKKGEPESIASSYKEWESRKTREQPGFSHRRVDRRGKKGAGEQRRFPGGGGKKNRL